MQATVTMLSSAQYLARLGWRQDPTAPLFVRLANGTYAEVANDGREPDAPSGRRILIADIQTVTAKHFRTPIEDMTSARRTRDLVRPRQVAMYLATRLTRQSLPEIGRRFGGRDHTTVIHAARQIEALRICDAELDVAVAAIERKLLA